MGDIKRNIKGKYLISTDNWFIAPDGLQYKSAWGQVEILTDELLGIKTNRNASNWFAKIGTERNHIIVAGCQIHYACKSEEKPNINDVFEDIQFDGKFVTSKRPTRIYITE
jgi:hypothetical protein